MTDLYHAVNQYGANLYSEKLPPFSDKIRGEKGQITFSVPKAFIVGIGWRALNYPSFSTESMGNFR